MGKIRIIGGQWRGQKISVPAQEVRPTPDRVRETLFNWLRPHLLGSVCFDAFAGTGILGLEALSHGASKVYFNDKSSCILKALEKNLLHLKTQEDRYRLMQCTLPQPLPITSLVHILFLDPPFHQQALDKLLPWLQLQTWLRKDAFIYIECENTYEFPLTPWEIYRQKRAGKVCYSLLRKKTGESP